MSRKNRPHPSAAAASDEAHDEVAPDEAGGLAADDVEAADGFVPVGAPADGATPVTLPAGADAPAAPDPESLQKRIDALEARLVAGGGTGAIPAGFKLVPAGPDQETKSRDEQIALKAELDRGIQARTQEHCNRLFPEGKHVWRCVLKADRNGHPELLVRAANETDATARYLAACGINHTEHKVVVVRA